MSSKVSINVKYPEIVVPDTDVPGANTPDTGMFSTGQISDAGISNSMLPIVGVSIISFVILALIIGLIVRRIKDKKCKSFAIHHAGRSVLRIACLVTILSLSAFALFEYGGHKTETVEAWSDGSTPIAPVPNTGEELSVTTEDIAINVTLDDKPVFATTKSTVTVDAATTNGYTLMAYIDSNTSDLTNETNTKATTKITGLESSYSQPLTDNTWGVALSLPENQDAPVFRGLPTTEAMTIKVTGSTATPANDTTELYYAAYVTPDLEEGTYTGATVNYVAISNPVGGDITVKFNTHNEDTGRDELFNTVTYGLDCPVAYVGGNCHKAYAGETTTITAADGVIDEISFDGEYSYDISLIPITYSEIDAVKIGVSINGEGNWSVSVIKGTYSDAESLMAKMQEVEAAGGDPNDLFVYNLEYFMLPDDGYHEFELSGDAFTIVSFPYHQKEFDDFTYEITPIFMTKPSNINTNETIVCALTDSDEATGEVYEYDGEWYGLSSIRSITIPGADGLRVEITYTFPPEYLRLGVIEGGAQELYYANSYYFSSYDNEISGSKVINIEGDMATFDFSGYYPYDEKDEYISNYGFSAKIYPIYNNEIEGTIPTQICKIVEKSGTYREPDYFDNGCWVWYWKPENTFDYSSMIDPGSLGRFGIKSWLYLNYDLFSGTILNFYSYNNCMS